MCTACIQCRQSPQCKVHRRCNTREQPAAELPWSRIDGVAACPTSQLQLTDSLIAESALTCQGLDVVACACDCCLKRGSWSKLACCSSSLLAGAAAITPSWSPDLVLASKQQKRLIPLNSTTENPPVIRLLWVDATHLPTLLLLLLRRMRCDNASEGMLIAAFSIF